MTRTWRGKSRREVTRLVDTFTTTKRPELGGLSISEFLGRGGDVQPCLDLLERDYPTSAKAS